VPQVFVDFGNGSGGGTNTLTEVTLRDSSGTALITPLAAGTYRVYFDIPGGTFGAPIQPVAMRVRLSSSGGLLATGPASDGEVEDYIFKFGPTSIGLVNFSARSSAPFTLWLVLLVAVAALVMTGIFWRLSRRRVQ
jgi:hypothetical protein